MTTVLQRWLPGIYPPYSDCRSWNAIHTRYTDMNCRVKTRQERDTGGNHHDTGRGNRPQYKDQNHRAGYSQSIRQTSRAHSLLLPLRRRDSLRRKPPFVQKFLLMLRHLGQLLVDGLSALQGHEFIVELLVEPDALQDQTSQFG